MGSSGKASPENKTKEDSSVRTTLITARYGLIVAIIIASGTILVPIIGKLIANDNERVSIAKTNQENILRELDAQISGAMELLKSSNSPHEKELLTGFIEDVEKTKKGQKEHSDKFIEKLINNEVTSAELARTNANIQLISANERINILKAEIFFSKTLDSLSSRNKLRDLRGLVTLRELSKQYGLDRREIQELLKPIKTFNFRLRSPSEPVPILYSPINIKSFQCKFMPGEYVEEKSESTGKEWDIGKSKIANYRIYPSS